MKETAIAQMLQNCDITDSQITINIQEPDGAVREITLKDPEDFMNEVVPKGSVVNLVFPDWKIYTGIFDTLEDDNGEFVLYIRPISGASWEACLPFAKLVGYYTDADK